MTTVRHDVPATTSTARLTALRANCLAATVLLIIQFGLGTAVNLYVTVPKHRSLLPAVFSSAMLAAHAIVALLLLASAVAALVRAIRSRRATALASAGLVAVLVAAAAGLSFVRDAGNGASLAMTLAAAIAMLCYVTALFSLR